MLVSDIGGLEAESWQEQRAGVCKPPRTGKLLGLRQDTTLRSESPGQQLEKRDGARLCKRVEGPGSCGDMGVGNGGVSGPKAGRHKGQEHHGGMKGQRCLRLLPLWVPLPLSLPSFLVICPSLSWSYTHTSGAFLGMRKLIRGMTRPS